MDMVLDVVQNIVQKQMNKMVWQMNLIQFYEMFIVVA